MTEPSIQEERRRCISCGSSETTTCWHKSKDPLWVGWLCHICYARIYTHQIYGKRRIKINGKQYYLDHSPRSGVCCECNRSISEGEIQRTNLCFLDIKEPKKNFTDAKEYCIRCHRKIHEKVNEILAAYYGDSAA